MPSLLILGLLAAAAPTYGITGEVRSAKTRGPVADALVIAQCTCLDGFRETITDSRGRYRFRHLPAGTYTIQVLHGMIDIAKVVTIGRPAAP